MICITFKMDDPSFASLENITDAAAGLKRLVRRIRECHLEFVAIQEATRYFIRWTKQYNYLELDPDFDDEDEPVIWTYPHQDRDIGTSLELAMGEMNAGEKFSDTTMLLDASVFPHTDTDVLLAFELLDMIGTVRDELPLLHLLQGNTGQTILRTLLT